jgi:tRNA(adenine34) deaminase
MYEDFMKIAFEEAKKSLLFDEVPVGAVIVKDNCIIAKAHNLRETLKSAAAHAEMLAIEEACRTLGGWRLIGCDMYVTLEPCPMCAGAAVNSRISRLIYGASDPKSGACGSVLNVASNEALNHRIEIVSGIMEEECRKLLQDFFRRKR